MIKFIVKLLIKWCEKTGRVFYITGGLKNETVYLARYIVFKSKYCCLYIHRFMRSDADDPHDHPWNFFTYVVDGSYTEHFYDKTKPCTYEGFFTALWSPKINVRKAGSVAYRKATDIHQVVVDKARNMDEIENAPLTICLMGRRLRDWGFWTDDGTTFTDWRKYLNISADDARIEGSE